MLGACIYHNGVNSHCVGIDRHMMHVVERLRDLAFHYWCLQLLMVWGPLLQLILGSLLLCWLRSAELFTANAYSGCTADIPSCPVLYHLVLGVVVKAVHLARGRQQKEKAIVWWLAPLHVVNNHVVAFNDTNALISITTALIFITLVCN